MPQPSGADLFEGWKLVPLMAEGCPGPLQGGVVIWAPPAGVRGTGVVSPGSVKMTWIGRAGSLPHQLLHETPTSSSIP